MIPYTWISELPAKPGVYALFGGQGKNRYVAYVGVADDLRRRITQHMVKRDSSVTTMTSAVCLNPDYVTQVKWWLHPSFSERFNLEAAELVAFDLLEPALRSRGGIQQKADQLYRDKTFYDQMEALFKNENNNCIIIPNIQTIIDKLESIEKRLEIVESKVK